MMTTSIDVAFRSPQTYPDAILVNFETEERMNVEFEEFSSDFKVHGHDPTKCDLIVCWIHDWNKRWTNGKCPLAVYEVGSGEGQALFIPSKKASPAFGFYENNLQSKRV